MTSARPPELLPISQCDTQLKFESALHWPEGLPAVAVNALVLAGFGQSLVFNHQIPQSDRTAIVNLVTSLYPHMSFLEAARFWRQARLVPWLPVDEILARWNVLLDEHWIRGAQLALNLPKGFQQWMVEKKISAQEMQMLGSAGDLRLETLLHSILAAGATRSQGVQALELGIELALMGQPMQELALQPDETGEMWIDRLRELRYPNSIKKEAEGTARLQNLPWPGQSQARWVRQGDKAGLELRLFVADPSDLKKSVTSLQKLQDLLEENPGTLWPKH